MSSSLTLAERRLASVLLAAAVAGTLWHTVDALRPPPPPVHILRGALAADSTGAPPLHEPRTGSVYSGEDTMVVPTPQRPLDLLIADEQALQMLPGVGPVLAERIVSWRARREGKWVLEDLLEVPGIGPTTLARIRPLVHVGKWR